MALRFASFLGLVWMATLTACGAEGSKTYPPYRYRLTVTVDTPQGPRSGSSVVEVRTYVAGKLSIPSPGMVHQTLKGQAVAIDLPNGKTLFALLRSDDDNDWALGVLMNQTPHPTAEESIGRDGKFDPNMDFDLWMQRVLALKGVQVLPRWLPPLYPGREPPDPLRSNYPMMVYFKDINNPATVDRVDPDNLSKVFGQGYKIDRVTAEPTQDAVSTGISSRFPWWERYHDRHFDGSSASIENPFDKPVTWLSSGSFSANL